MTLPCSAIVFDLDGVLVDSRTVVERHWRQWAQKHGLDPERVIHEAHGRRVKRRQIPTGWSSSREQWS